MHVTCHACGAEAGPPGHQKSPDSLGDWRAGAGHLDEETSKPAKPAGRPALLPEGSFPNFPTWAKSDEAPVRVPKPPASLVSDQQRVRSAATEAAW